MRLLLSSIRASRIVAKQPPSGPGWAHELKHDGYRLQIHIRDGRVKLYTINGADWSKRYPRIVESRARVSKLSVGAKWNEQTFICVQSNILDPCGNTCRRSDHADRNITDSDDRLWCQEHTVHYDRDRARPHLDSEDGAIGGEYRRALSLGSVEKLDQSQESESAGCNARYRWDFLTLISFYFRSPCTCFSRSSSGSTSPSWQRSVRVSIAPS